MLSDQASTLRTCGPGDEQALALVGAATFLESFAGILHGPDILAHCCHQHAEQKYAAWLASPSARLCLAEVKQAPIGYAVLCPPDLPIALTPTDIELKRIYLLHRFQKLGIGAALLNWSIEQARTLGMRRLLLGVYGGNEAALAFYVRNGFRQIGTRQFLVGATLHDDFVLGLDL
jgi:GNAT superfamily N-acetyltransferase